MSSKEEFSLLHSPNFTNLQYLAKGTKILDFKKKIPNIP